MKNLKYKIIYIIGLITFCTSCTDDLNVTPKDDDLFLSDDFFSSEDSYKQGLAGIYGNLSLTGLNGAESSNIQGIDAGTSQYGRCLWYMQDLAADQAIWSYENDPGVGEIQRNTWNANNPILRGMFGRAMFQVALVNEYLRQTTPEKLSSRGVTNTQLLNDVALYREEVKVLRALAYYHLMDLFGKAPFVTENDPINTAGPEYDRAELFSFIEEELTAVLPSLKEPKTNEYGRLDKAMAWMILAKIYLNAEVYINTPKYTECVTMCNNIINAGYTLEANYLDNFKADNHTSTEMIYSIQSDGTATQNYGPTTVLINGQVGSLEKNGASLGVGTDGWGGALRLRKQFVQKFNGTQFNTDERKTIISADRPIEITSISTPKQGYILAKYSNISSTGVAGSNKTFVDTDFPLFRLADVYLMYAECALRNSGNATKDQALLYVNELRERANNGTSSNITVNDLTLDFILDERARELHWESHRRQDLIRFGKFTGGSYNWTWKGNSQSGIAIPAHFNVYPIPAASLASNPNLTQNPNY
ncbi:RagB/SusD family nutrient uptake outer membrane protein [Flavobacterium sp. H122]|uniref:RagB/SusD family nutrient uptake outer membrane protein n=1 Tax=Flavobacterium sp. H122 TaxID=2529860 RepID=UPI0010AA246A|nr:RagB/SusD family nutrient uptake outer membrane protein [Flavobacterium sp. H122]